MDEEVAYPIRVAGVVPVTDNGPAALKWFQVRMLTPAPAAGLHGA
jgi:hypothetical protein